MTSPSSKGLHQLQQATERHLEKVAGKVVVWASDTSNTSANTRVADNRVAATAPAAESEVRLGGRGLHDGSVVGSQRAFFSFFPP